MLYQLTSVCTLLAIFNSVAAQTPAGFQPEVDTSLQLSFDGTEVTAPGELIPRDDTANPPSFSVPAGTANTGLVVMMDLDIDNGAGNPRTTLLHWMAYDIDLTATPANVPNGNGAAYWEPSPPAGDIAHRYVVVLFAQPDNFALPAQYADFSTTDERMGFNLATFATNCGLATPLAANYITVQNGTTAAATTTVATSAITQTTSMTTSSKLAASSTLSISLSSKAAAPTQFAMEWGILAGAGLIAAIA